MGRSHATSRNFTFSSGKLCEGQTRRLNKPLPSPPDCGKVRFHADFTVLWVRSGITHQYASHQSCRAQATWSKKQVTHTLTSLSLTPGLPGWGTERLQNREMVLPAQVYTKPHTPDDHRSEEGVLHFKLFKRYSFFPGSSLHVHNTDKLHLFCCPQITYLKENTSELQNAVIIVQMWGFFQEKNI